MTKTRETIIGIFVIIAAALCFHFGCEEEKPKSEREQLIEKQFDKMYGYHINVTDSVKKELLTNQVEVLQTNYFDQGNKLRVIETVIAGGFEFKVSADVTLYGTITHLTIR